MLGLKVKNFIDYMVVMSINDFYLDRHKKGLEDVLSFFDCCPWHAFQ